MFFKSLREKLIRKNNTNKEEKRINGEIDYIFAILGGKNIIFVWGKVSYFGQISTPGEEDGRGQKVRGNREKIRKMVRGKV